MVFGGMFLMDNLGDTGLAPVNGFARWLTPKSALAIGCLGRVRALYRCPVSSSSAGRRTGSTSFLFINCTEGDAIPLYIHFLYISKGSPHPPARDLAIVKLLAAI